MPENQKNQEKTATYELPVKLRNTYKHKFTFEGLDFYADDAAAAHRAARIFDGRVLMLIAGGSGFTAPGVHVDYDGECGVAFCPAAEGEESEDRVLSPEDILSKVDIPTAENMPKSEDADLPLITWENSAEVKGGNLTDLGFARLIPGFQFRGFILRTMEVDSQFGDAKPVLNDQQQPIMVSGAPLTRKVQTVVELYGTARVPVKGSNAFGTIDGKLKIPLHERLKQPVADNFAKEAEMTQAARRRDPNARPVKIPVEINYRQQEPDREAKNGEGKARAGAHVYEVKRITLVTPFAK